MKLGFLYGGQGSQTVGMGREFYEQEPLFRQVYDHAPVDFDLRRLCLEGPEEELSRTRYTQCCLLAYQIGMTKLLAWRGIVPRRRRDCPWGSMGPYMGPRSCPKKRPLPRWRCGAGLWRRRLIGLNCGMTAVLGLEREPLEEACRRAAGLGVVEICNDNCPGQLVISGEQEAVTAAGNYALELGAKRCMPLKVSGPFHTSLMAPAGDVLEAHFRQISFETPKFPVYFNCLGDATGRSGEDPTAAGTAGPDRGPLCGLHSGHGPGWGGRYGGDRPGENSDRFCEKNGPPGADLLYPQPGGPAYNRGGVGRNKH